MIAFFDYVKQAKSINSFKNCLDRHRGTPSRNQSRPTENMMNRGIGNLENS